MTRYREMLSSKIHGAVLTKKEVNYHGSIGIDECLLKKADILPDEKVQVLNFNNGNRFETYVIKEQFGSGIIALYGPAARLGEVGDRLCIISYIYVDENEAAFSKARVVLVNEVNQADDF